MHESAIAIVTPALADANNGNWRTARRWAEMLDGEYRVRLTRRWNAAEGRDDALMIALHARRSAASIAAWRAAAPRRPLIVVLTGTDLYRDIDADPEARHSLELADALVVLNELGGERLPLQWRAKCRVVLQSCPAPSARIPRASGRESVCTVVMVGHLRDEKDPGTYFRAVRRLAQRADLRFEHLGAALDRALGQEAAALAASRPSYRWLGSLPHAATLAHIARADMLVHPSRIEGGAHVVIEAVRCGTPVLASRVDGNVGLLGAEYGGYFPVGDDAALAALMERGCDDPAMLPALRRQLMARAPRFAPEAEAAALRRIVAALLERPLPEIRA